MAANPPQNGQGQGGVPPAVIVGAGGAAAAGGGPPAPPSPPPVKFGDLPLPNPKGIAVIKRRVAAKIMDAIEQAGYRELAALNVPDAARWNVRRPDVEALALQLTDDAFGKVLTTARDRLRTALSEELGKTQDQFQIAAALRERFGGMHQRDARRVVRTVFRDLYNQTSLDVYEKIGVTHVLANDGHGGLTGRTDPACIERNGQVFTIAEARELKAYHPTVHPNCTLGFAPILPEGGLDPQALELPPVEEPPPPTDLAADQGSEDQMLKLAWTPDQEALQPRWPAHTPGVDKNGHPLAGEYLHFKDLLTAFSHTLNPHGAHDMTWLAHGADNIASIKVTPGAPGEDVAAEPKLVPAVAGSASKGKYLFDSHGTYLGQITGQAQSGYYGARTYYKSPTGGVNWIYSSDIPAYQMSDNGPAGTTVSATFDIVLKAKGLSAPAHIRVHVDQVENLKTGPFVKFLAAVNNGEDLTHAKGLLDAAQKASVYKPTLKGYAKPTIHQKLNYAKYQKHIGGGKQEGNLISVSALKVGDTIKLPGTSPSSGDNNAWDAGENEGEIAKVTQKVGKKGGYLNYEIQSGPNAGQIQSKYIGYGQADSLKVAFGTKATPPPPPPKVGGSYEIEKLKLGAKVGLPDGSEATVAGLAPDGGIFVSKPSPLGQGPEMTTSIPIGTKVKYLEKPPVGGGDTLQPGILDQFEFTKDGKVIPPTVIGHVEPETHDPSIPIPAGYNCTPAQWERFGKADQERITYLQMKFGPWAASKSNAVMDEQEKSVHKQIWAKAVEAYAAQYAKTGVSGVVTETTGNTSGGAGKMTLKEVNKLSQAQWDSVRANVDPEGRFNSWAEAMNDALLRIEEVAQWDMYNRVGGEPDVIACHQGGGSWKNIIESGQAITGGASYAYKPISWESQATVVAFPIRYLTMNYFCRPSAVRHKFPGEHEVSPRFFMKFDPHGSDWGMGSTQKFTQAWNKLGFPQAPVGGSRLKALLQEAGFIQMSPQEKYAAMPTSKAKTLLPGAKFMEGGKGFPIRTVVQVYSDGSFHDDVGHYYPADADVKMTAQGKPPVDAGKLLDMPMSQTVMGMKVYDADGKVIGYVSTAGQYVKYLKPDGEKEKVGLGPQDTIKTVAPVPGSALNQGDQFYVPGLKGKVIGTVVSTTAQHLTYTTNGTDATAIPVNSDVFPLPKPDSAFGPLPDPPKDAKPFVPNVPEPEPVKVPDTPPAPVPASVVNAPVAQPHTPGTPLHFDNVQVGQTIQVDSAGAQSFIGTKAEVTYAGPDKVTFKYLDGPQAGKFQDVLPSQWDNTPGTGHASGKVKFSQVGGTPAASATTGIDPNAPAPPNMPTAKNPTVEEIAAYIATAPQTDDAPGVLKESTLGDNLPKIGEFPVGTVIYQNGKPWGYIAPGPNDTHHKVMPLDGDGFSWKKDMSIHAGFWVPQTAAPAPSAGEWPPPNPASGLAPGPFKVADLKPGDTFWYGGTDVIVDSVTAKPGGKFLVKAHTSGGEPKTWSAISGTTGVALKPGSPTAVAPPVTAPSAPGTLAAPPSTNLADYAKGAQTTLSALPDGAYFTTPDGGIMQKISGDGYVHVKLDHEDAIQPGQIGHFGAHSPVFPLTYNAPAPAAPTLATFPQHPVLTKTKVKTLQVGDHYYAYTTENYVGEVTAKNADGGVTVTTPDGKEKHYGPNTSMKKGATAPQTSTGAPSAAAPAAPGKPQASEKPAGPTTLDMLEPGDQFTYQGQSYTYGHYLSNGDQVMAHPVGGGPATKLWAGSDVTAMGTPTQKLKPMEQGHAVYGSYVYDANGMRIGKWTHEGIVPTPGAATIPWPEGEKLYVSDAIPGVSPGGKVTYVHPAAAAPPADTGAVPHVGPGYTGKIGDLAPGTVLVNGSGEPVATIGSHDPESPNTQIVYPDGTDDIVSASSSVGDVVLTAAAKAAPAPLPAPPTEPVPEIPKEQQLGPGVVKLMGQTANIEHVKYGSAVYDKNGAFLGHVDPTHEQTTLGTAVAVTGPHGTTSLPWGTPVYINGPNAHSAGDKPTGGTVSIVAGHNAGESGHVPLSVDPKAVPSKKAGSFEVGQPVYNYHSGKLIGTVSGKGDGVVSVTLPNGDTKTYKSTTTWKYHPAGDKVTKPPHVPEPPAAPAAQAPAPPTLTALPDDYSELPVGTPIYSPAGDYEGTFQEIGDNDELVVQTPTGGTNYIDPSQVVVPAGTPGTGTTAPSAPEKPETPAEAGGGLFAPAPRTPGITLGEKHPFKDIPIGATFKGAGGVTWQKTGPVSAKQIGGSGAEIHSFTGDTAANFPYEVLSLPDTPSAPTGVPPHGIVPFLSSAPAYGDPLYNNMGQKVGTYIATGGNGVQIASEPYGDTKDMSPHALYVAAPAPSAPAAPAAPAFSVDTPISDLKAHVANAPQHSNSDDVHSLPTFGDTKVGDVLYSNINGQPFAVVVENDGQKVKYKKLNPHAKQAVNTRNASMNMTLLVWSPPAQTTAAPSAPEPMVAPSPEDVKEAIADAPDKPEVPGSKESGITWGQLPVGTVIYHFQTGEPIGVIGPQDGGEAKMYHKNGSSMAFDPDDPMNTGYTLPAGTPPLTGTATAAPASPLDAEPPISLPEAKSLIESAPSIPALSHDTVQAANVPVGTPLYGNDGKAYAIVTSKLADGSATMLYKTTSGDYQQVALPSHAPLQIAPDVPAEPPTPTLKIHAVEPANPAALKPGDQVFTPDGEHLGTVQHVGGGVVGYEPVGGGPNQTWNTKYDPIYVSEGHAAAISTPEPTPGPDVPTGAAGLIDNGSIITFGGKTGTLVKNPGAWSFHAEDGTKHDITPDTIVGFVSGPPEPAAAPAPVDVPDTIDPKANPSKKAKAFAAGDAVYNYHSGKKIGTVLTTDDGEGNVVIETPSGTTKTYKPTTTWKYLGGAKGAAVAPPKPPSAEAPPQTPGDVLGAPDTPHIQTLVLPTEPLTVQGGAGGTQGAQWATDPEGNKYVVKGYGGDQNRVATEALASTIYKHLGVDVPEGGVVYIGGKRYFASKALPSSAKPKKLKGQPKSQELGQGFMADALLANWDVIGANDDNILWDANGKPYRVDVGGTMFYRAMGNKKAFGSTPVEVTKMLQKGRQAERTMVVTDEMMKLQAQAIASHLTPALIHDLVAEAGFSDPEMAKKVEAALIARVAWMQKFGAGQVGMP